MPSGLWIVATPIGNLQDLSPRARCALEEADAILCEDTRRTAKLLSVLLPEQPLSKLERLDAHARPERIQSMVERLQSGESFAFVSDAGTPGISDPGSALAEAAYDAGIQVTPIPGPSAPMAALSVAGFHETAFVFRGFFPRKKSERQREVQLAIESSLARVFVWFESPERILEMLSSLAEGAPDCVVFAVKELTKLHERSFRGPSQAVLAEVRAEIEKDGPRGEWCVVVLFRQTEAGGMGESSPESSDWVKALDCLLDARVPASEAARQVSRHFDISKKTVYDRSLQILGKK